MFGPFERMVAFRYLRARRAEGFISVISIFSLLGIALGVATLIIVMSVMNGFRAELLGRILGLNGHLGVYSTQAALADYDAIAKQVTGVPGVVRAAGQHVLVDCGPGALRRLAQAGVGLHAVDAVLLTHYHTDHCADLAALLFALHGKTYAGSVTIKAKDTIELSGCVALVLCRTTSWTRVK